MSSVLDHPIYFKSFKIVCTKNQGTLARPSNYVFQMFRIHSFPEEDARGRGDGMIHELKTWPKQFWDIVNRYKTFEVRKYDRDFRAGDTLELLEYNPKTNEYTGLMVMVLVTYACFLPSLDDYVGMSIEVITVSRLNDGVRKE